MIEERLDRLLWFAFGVLFVVVASSSFLPVRPLVWAYPLWAVVVLGACLVTLVLAVAVVRAGWPGEVSET